MNWTLRTVQFLSSSVARLDGRSEKVGHTQQLFSEIPGIVFKQRSDDISSSSRFWNISTLSIAVLSIVVRVVECVILKGHRFVSLCVCVCM